MPKLLVSTTPLKQPRLWRTLRLGIRAMPMLGSYLRKGRLRNLPSGNTRNRTSPKPARPQNTTAQIMARRRSFFCHESCGGWAVRSASVAGMRFWKIEVLVRGVVSDRPVRLEMPLAAGRILRELQNLDAHDHHGNKRQVRGIRAPCKRGVKHAVQEEIDPDGHGADGHGVNFGGSSRSHCSPQIAHDYAVNHEN